MKTKVFLNWVFILLILSSSCSRDDLFLEREALSPVGDKFMQIVHSSPDWESQWAKIQEIGRPMPNDAVFVYISCSGAYSIIPILSKNSKEIEGLAFYPLVTDDNSERLPKIIPKDAINRDFASRIFIKSESFSQWEKRGYTLSVKLDPLDYRMFSSPLTKSYGSAFPFQFTVRYDSSYDYYTMVQDVKHVFEYAPNLLPRGIELHYEWGSYYAIMIIDRAPSGMKGEEVASLCLSYAQTALYSIPGVLSVEIIPLWDTDSGGGGGGGSGGSVTPPDPDQEKEEEECRHEICVGCKKPIRPNTRATLNCSHSDNDFCRSLGPVCDCGERHCDDETGLPKCAEASYWIIFGSLNAGIEHVKSYIKTTKIELAGISMTSGKTYIQYDPRNTSGGSYFTLGECRKLDNGRIFFIDAGTLKRDYIELFFHGHPQIENKIKIIEGIKGMYASELKISEEDYMKLSTYGCQGLIVTEFATFRYTSSRVESIFCPLYVQ